MRKDMYAMARWWLDLGIDGFRVDAIAHLARDLSFEDSTLQLNDHGVAPDWSKFSNREELFTYIHEFNEEVLSRYDCVSVGEVGGGASIEDGLRYAGTDAKAFNMVFNFDHCWCVSYEHPDTDQERKVIQVRKLKREIERWILGMEGKGWLPHYWLNHDHPRVMSQYGDPQHHHRASGTLLACVLLSLKGTPFIYNGEEIGMTNVDYTRLDEFQDVWVKNNRAALLKKADEATVVRQLKKTSRDNARTPMQWSHEPNAGFSTGENVQKVNQNYRVINVEAQDKDPDSILNAYRQLIRLRRSSPYRETLVYGSFALIRADDEDVFAFERIGDKHLVVLANFRSEPAKFRMLSKIKTVVYSNHNRTDYQHQTLQAFEALILELDR